MNTQTLQALSSLNKSSNYSDDTDLETNFSWENAKEVVNQLLSKNTGKHLTDLEAKILQDAWQGKTYYEMAEKYGYSPEYLNKDVGNKLWKKLSNCLPEKVTKSNFKEALKRAKKSLNTARVATQEKTSSPVSKITFLEGSVPLNSPFYLQREQIELLSYATIMKPGSLLRIKAPKLMGKTSLIMRILAEATNQKYQAVYLNLGSVDKGILTNLDKFLRWLCLKTSKQLNLSNHLNEYWDTDILGSNDNCTGYFEEYLLAENKSPLVLALDEVDRLFPHTEVIEDFFGMLRSWHEKGKMSQPWQQLRLIIAHSTEIYIPLDINQSPFNAGITVELNEFNEQQINSLVRLHELNWNHHQIKQIMAVVGGHPYLLRLTMYYLSSAEIELEQILSEASDESGIYNHHLRGQMLALKQVPELAEAFKIVVDANEPVELDSLQIYKLHSLGLVQRKGNQVVPRCRLYRDYFRRVLS
ncbi:MAG: AAA-like domain-containing protein [Oscillatoria sp. PMC 1051.18]|nr:AAA-like domain-containing protein [Oscillatoria sp. PMC 1050.18]MEC5031183.1 AAA-like domain-containing protein [Oscillatoria sp. PMC 1051.18]